MSEEIKKILLEMGKEARNSSQKLALASAEQKNQSLHYMADNIDQNVSSILDANNKDIEKAKENNISQSFLDRLILNDDRIKSMSIGLRSIAGLEDPVGQKMAKWQRPNGLDIERVRTPLGVIGVIYESRPNVTADAGSLCLKAGNAAILRGGSESFFSSEAIHSSLKFGLMSVGLPETCIQMVPTCNREAVSHMLNMIDTIDVIVPRGGKSLIDKISKESV